MVYTWTYLTFWSWFWFFFIYIPVVILWIWIIVDIIKRSDQSGLAKVGWIILVFILPFIGSLIYLAVRPNNSLLDTNM